MSELHTAFFIDVRCPRCGSALISNGTDVWCSFVGGNGQPACSFGLDYDVHIDGLPAAIEHERKQEKANDSDATGVSVFGHATVADAVAAIRAMTAQEMRVMAETLAQQDAMRANQLIDLLIDAFADQPAPMDAERHARIGRMVRSVTDEEVESELADERMLHDSGILAELISRLGMATQPAALANSYVLLDEEEYYGQALPASAQ